MKKMSTTLEVVKMDLYGIFENHEQYELRLGQTLSGENVRPFVIKF
jgi:thiol-disulfide isomerase/thioredoxin